MDRRKFLKTLGVIVPSISFLGILGFLGKKPATPNNKWRHIVIGGTDGPIGYIDGAKCYPGELKWTQNFTIPIDPTRKFGQTSMWLQG